MFFFDVGEEYNLPTWFASGLWLILGLVAIVTLFHATRFKLSWGTFALVAFSASIDEFVQIHERLNQVGEMLAINLGIDELLFYMWIVPGLMIAVLVVALLLRLAIWLPSGVRGGVFAGGVVFLLGAVGFETVGGLLYKYGYYRMNILAVHLEEWLEMIGLSIAIASVIGMVEIRREGHGFATSFRGYREQLSREVT